LKRRKSGKATNLKGRELPGVHPLFEENAYNSKRIWNLKKHPYSKIQPGQRREVNELVESKIKPKFPKLMPEGIKDYPVSLDYRIFKMLKHKPTLKQPSTGGASCSGGGIIVKIPKSERWKNSEYNKIKVVYHEFGHAVHFQRGIVTPHGTDPVFRAFFDKIRNKYSKPRATNKNPHPIHPGAELHVRLANLYMDNEENRGRLPDYLKGETMQDVKEMIGATADTLEALTNCTYGWGHGKTYFNRGRWFREAEVFAHMSENGFCGNPVFENEAPEMFKATIEYFNNHYLKLITDED